MTQEDDDRAPGGMEAVPDQPVGDSDEPGGMSGIPEPDPPDRQIHDKED
jgi:hypothetical protein